MAGSGDVADTDGSPLTRIRAAAGTPARLPCAVAGMSELLDRLFDFTVVPDSLRFDADNPLALNSLRAEFRTTDGQHLFLKCHHEAGEQDRVGEYYRSGILEQAGFPIEKALYQSSAVGEQLVIYRYRDRRAFPELHGVARAIEAGGCDPLAMEPVVQAFDRFQQRIGERYLDSLHLASPAEIDGEAVHGLYHRRLVDHPGDAALGGRVREFYQRRQVSLPGGLVLPFERFQDLRWVINGQRVGPSLHEALHRARQLLHPRPSAPMPAVTAHGDDHTGNLLYDPSQGAEEALMYFDPAFAGHHVPALMAPCKALYHVCYAHPDMLYDPDELHVDLSVALRGDTVHLEHDWHLTPLRQHLLDAQVRHVWQPLIQAMRQRGALASRWPEVVGSALLCCPVLCKNLLAGAGHPNPLTPEASVLTFSIALQLGDGAFTDRLSV